MVCITVGQSSWSVEHWLAWFLKFWKETELIKTIFPQGYTNKDVHISDISYTSQILWQYHKQGKKLRKNAPLSPKMQRTPFVVSNNLISL